MYTINIDDHSNINSILTAIQTIINDTGEPVTLQNKDGELFVIDLMQSLDDIKEEIEKFIGDEYKEIVLTKEWMMGFVSGLLYLENPAGLIRSSASIYYNEAESIVDYVTNNTVSAQDIGEQLCFILGMEKSSRIIDTLCMILDKNNFNN